MALFIVVYVVFVLVLVLVFVLVSMPVLVIEPHLSDSLNIIIRLTGVSVSVVVLVIFLLRGAILVFG